MSLFFKRARDYKFILKGGQNMGKDLSLREQILEEISRREEARLRKEKGAEKSAKEGVRQKILKGFEDELNRLLEEREEFKRFRIPDEFVCRRYVRKVAEELGFKIEMIYDYEEIKHFFVLVPKFETEQCTFAQERLKKFEEDLKQAKIWRKCAIREECRRILGEIRNGNYGYYEKDKIYIESEEKKLDLDDKQEIEKFFLKYHLRFLKFVKGKLYFCS